MKRFVSILLLSVAMVGCNSATSAKTDVKVFNDSKNRSLDLIQQSLTLNPYNTVFPIDRNDAVDLPPPQYNHVYYGKIHILWVRYWDIATACGRSNTRKWVVQACEAPESNESNCYITLPVLYPSDRNKIWPQKLLDLFVHERGHCEGWVHPDKMVQNP